MKVKTNFKKMVLIDAHAFESMNYNPGTIKPCLIPNMKSPIIIKQQLVPQNSTYQTSSPSVKENESSSFPRYLEKLDREKVEKKENQKNEEFQNVNHDIVKLNDPSSIQHSSLQRSNDQLDAYDENQPNIDISKESIHNPHSSLGNSSDKTEIRVKPKDNNNQIKQPIQRFSLNDNSDDTINIDENVNQERSLETQEIEDPQSKRKRLSKPSNIIFHPSRSNENTNDVQYLPYQVSPKSMRKGESLRASKTKALVKRPSYSLVEKKISSIEDRPSLSSTHTRQSVHSNIQPPNLTFESGEVRSLDYSSPTPYFEFPNQNVQLSSPLDHSYGASFREEGQIQTPSNQLLPKLEYRPQNVIQNNQDLQLSPYIQKNHFQNNINVPEQMNSSLNHPSVQQRQGTSTHSSRKKIDYDVPLAIKDDSQKASPLYLQYYEPKESHSSRKDKIVFFCTLCNRHFNKKSALLRHNKNIHDAFYQTEKGEKRKFNDGDETSNKRLKSFFGTKRKASNGISSTPKKLKSLTNTNGLYDSYVN